MGRERTRAAEVTRRLSVGLITALASLLEPAERDAIVGDFLDSGDTFFQGFRGVIGLILRRQLGLWKKWEPWAALIGIVVVAGPLLSRFVWDIEAFYSVTTVGAYFSSVEHWNGQDWTTAPTARDVVFFVCFSLVIIMWSWVSGFVLGSFSGKTLWLTGVAMYLTVLNFAPMASGTVSLHSAGAPTLPVFLLDRLQMWTKSESLLFFIPVMFGVRSGLRRNLLPLSRALFIGSLISLSTSVMVGMSAWGYQIDTSHGTIGAWGAPAFNLQSLLASWPLIYVMCIAWRTVHRTVGRGPHSLPSTEP
jgi:hypothetical protein